jgi:alpha-mannosidase
VVSLLCNEKEFVDKESMSALNSYRYLKSDDTSGKALKATNNRITVKENGPLIATLQVESEAEGCYGLIREITVLAGQSHIEFTNKVDKIAITDKEGIHFGFAFDIPNPVTKVDIPWGVMELEKDQLSAGNRNWIAFQRWLNISNENKSVTWCALDACSFESGDMTANILGGAFASPQWIRKLEPASTVYSWALNNHWHTNFSLSQKGKITFRYRVLPHNGKYEAASANRFGMEQIQPLLVTAVNEDFELQSNLSVHAAPSVVTSIIKTVDEGKASIIRLRSVSDTDQDVQIEWKSKKPRSLVLCTTGEEKDGATSINDKVRVPAQGFVTLRADW